MVLIFMAVVLVILVFIVGVLVGSVFFSRCCYPYGGKRGRGDDGGREDDGGKEDDPIDRERG